jgi:hypothetical protein
MLYRIIYLDVSFHHEIFWGRNPDPNGGGWWFDVEGGWRRDDGDALVVVFSVNLSVLATRRSVKKHGIAVISNDVRCGNSISIWKKIYYIFFAINIIWCILLNSLSLNYTPTDASLKGFELSRRSFVFLGQHPVLPNAPCGRSCSENNDAAQDCCSNWRSDGHFLFKQMCVF